MRFSCARVCAQAYVLRVNVETVHSCVHSAKCNVILCSCLCSALRRTCERPQPCIAHVNVETVHSCVHSAKSNVILCSCLCSALRRTCERPRPCVAHVNVETVHSCVHSAKSNRELKKNIRGRRRRQAVKIFRHNPCVFFSMYCFGYTVSIFAEIHPLPSACLPKRKDRR